MENCVFKKILTQDDVPVRIHLTLVENSFQLIVLQKEDAWTSFVTTEDLNNFATQHCLNVQNYCEKLLDYIKTPNSSVTFDIKKNKLVINRLLDNNLKVKYFTCALEKANYVEQVEQIMDNFYLKNLKYIEELNAVTKEIHELGKEKNNCEQRLHEVIERKKIDEDEQFGQFILILNEKKKRIQHLTELLEAFKSGRPTNNAVVEIKSRKKKAKENITAPIIKKVETISESEPSESSDVATDEENTAEGMTSTAHLNQPSTSTFDFLQEDNIPQSCILPKRIKYESGSKDTIPTISKPPQPKPLDEEPKKVGRSESPSIDISTQQLLDML